VFLSAVGAEQQARDNALVYFESSASFSSAVEQSVSDFNSYHTLLSRYQETRSRKQRESELSRRIDSVVEKVELVRQQLHLAFASTECTAALKSSCTVMNEQSTEQNG
jgi:hypothetical protein